MLQPTVVSPMLFVKNRQGMGGAVRLGLGHGPAAPRPFAHAALDEFHVGVATLFQCRERGAGAVLGIANEVDRLVFCRRDFTQSCGKLPHWQELHPLGDARGSFIGLTDVNHDNPTRIKLRAGRL